MKSSGGIYTDSSASGILQASCHNILPDPFARISERTLFPDGQRILKRCVSLVRGIAVKSIPGVSGCGPAATDPISYVGPTPRHPPGDAFQKGKVNIPKWLFCPSVV